VDFGYTLPSSINGFAFNDANGTGSLDDWWGGEYRLGGWTVFLDADEDGVMDAGEMRTVTDGDGVYEFGRLMPGRYVVRTVVQPGWESTLYQPAHTLNLGPGGGVLHLQTGVRRLAGVAGRQVFYKNSSLDARGDDGAAIARDKQALLPGQTASFANVTSFGKGINGVIIDLPLAYPPNWGEVTYKVGAGGNPSTWAAAPQPTSFRVSPRVGVGGTDRLTITWADGAIVNQWLQVTILPGGAGRPAGLAGRFLLRQPGRRHRQRPRRRHVAGGHRPRRRADAAQFLAGRGHRQPLRLQPGRPRGRVRPGPRPPGPGGGAGASAHHGVRPDCRQIKKPKILLRGARRRRT
jgi:hypothetical protein